MVLDAPLRDELRKSGNSTKGGQIMEISENARRAALRDTLLLRVSDGLNMAFAASRALVHLRSDSTTDPDILGDVNMYDKAAEQAIDLIVDSQREKVASNGMDHSEMPDDNGQMVSDSLQAALMIAVWLKSDIFDKMDNQ